MDPGGIGRRRSFGPAARRLVRVGLIAGLVVGIDQATKAWALAALGDGPIELVGDAVRFRLVRNTGSAFSLFSGQATTLAIFGGVLIVVILRMAHRERDRWLSGGLALLLGGAVGNLTDRVVRGSGFLDGAVVDFVDLGRWPTFNVADAAITIGAALLLVRAWAAGRDGADAGQPAEEVAEEVAEAGEAREEGGRGSHGRRGETSSGSASGGAGGGG